VPLLTAKPTAIGRGLTAPSHAESRKRETELEPGDEPEAEPLPQPTRPVRDYLAEAVALKAQILDLLKMMQPIERTEFRRALIEEVEAMERTLNN